MDFLEQNFGPKVEDFDLNALIQAQTTPPSLPQGALRNRAATVSLLTGNPEQALQNYDMLMKEGQEGGNVAYDQARDTVLNTAKTSDMKGIMTVLGDPSATLEQKQAAIKNINAPEMQDTTNILRTKALEAPSEGENPGQEDTRINTINSIRQVQKEAAARQGLVNAHAATLDNASFSTLVDAFALDVLPFSTAMSAEGVMRSFKENIGEKVSMWDVIKAVVAPGHSLADTRARLESFPPSRREEVNKAMLAAINSSSGIIFPADNHYAEVRKLEQMLSQGGFSTTEKWIETVAGALDVLAMGFLVRGGAKALKGAREATKVHPAEWELVDEVVPKRATKKKAPPAEIDERIAIEDKIKRIEVNATVRKENPSSPASVMQQANPAKARAMHATVAKATTDEAAEALYGTTKAQAIINDVVPQAVTESGAVTAKVVDIDRNLRKELQIDDDLANLIHDTGANYYTRAEAAAVGANLVRKFDESEGLVPHDAESGFSVVGGRVRIDGMYGTPEGGFSLAEDAITQAKFALRHTGVIDSDITIMKRSGIDYVPVSLDEVRGTEGDYKVRITAYREISPDDVGNYEKLITKRNWTDSLSQTVTEDRGSLTRIMFDAASVIDPKIAGPASVATDLTSRFEKTMLQKATLFSDKFDKLDATRQSAINNYIREANYNRIKFDPNALIGFSLEEVDTLRSWKNFWDSHYYLENYDVVRTLAKEGYQLFKNANTELYAKPIPKNQNIGWFYDPSVDDVVRWGQGEGDVLYAAGGTYAKLRRPTDFNGVTVEHMIIRNTPTEYSRAFRDTDSVLPYRDGYFQLQYKKNAKFIDETIYNSNGTKIGVKTIAVAGDTAEAMSFVKRTAGNAGKSVLDFNIRGDANGLRRAGDEWWDLASSSGRVSQRHRGKLLEDASGLNHLGDGSYVVNPVDSAVRAARSISGRTVNRPMLEAAKARFMATFESVIPEVNGVKRFPNNLEQIGQKGEPTNKLVRDARTNYEYIRYLEGGYINAMDEVFKQGFHAAATSIGSAIKQVGGKYPKTGKALANVESGLLRAADVSVSGSLKGSVFTATIVSNVFRQWIVQPHQVLRTLAYNPKGWGNGAIIKLLAGYPLDMMGAWNHAAATSPIFAGTRGLTNTHVNVKDFVEFVDNSGLMASVDKSNLVRGTLLNAADSSNKIVRNVAKYTTTPARMAGFDLGEMANLLGHAAAVYERRMRKGGDLRDLKQRDEAYAEIRAISGAMNAAGDMPYNQTWPSFALQFLQVPHKMFLLQTNRLVESAAARRILFFDMVMWGSPAATIAAAMGADILPDDPFNKELFVNGLESALLNNMLGGLENYNLKTDFTSLDPYGVDGWVKAYTNFMTGGPQKLILNSPSGQLFLKDGGKVQNAINHVSRVFGFRAEIDETPETLWQATKEVAQIFSGLSNLTKAQLILETGKVVDKSGKVVAEGLSTQSALLQMFGFGPASTRDTFHSIEKINNDVKAHKEAVVQDYKEIVNYYTSTMGTDNQQAVWQDKIVNTILRTKINDPVAMEIINGLLLRDMQDKESTMYKLFEKRIRIEHQSLGGLRDEVKLMPVSDDAKEQMLNIIEDVENAFKKQNEGDK